MDATLLVLRLVLAGVFGLAAVTKLVDLEGSRAAMEGFGLPKRLAAPAGLALPLAELTTALLLLPLATSWWGALAGLVLMLAFVAGIGYSLSQGRTPDCHCFGQVYSEPIGRGTLIRNGVLALLAGVLVLRGPDGQGSSLVGWVDDTSTVEGVLLGLTVITLAAVAAMGWFLVHLLKQSGRLLVRLDALEAAQAAGGLAPAQGVPAAAAAPPALGLPVGAPAPAFSLAGLHGETATLAALRAADKPLLLLFTSPACGPCNALLPDVGRWQRDHGGTLTIALLSEGSADANRGKAAEHGLINVLLQERREVADAYQATGTPGAVVVRPDGTVGSPARVGSRRDTGPAGAHRRRGRTRGVAPPAAHRRERQQRCKGEPRQRYPRSAGPPDRPQGGRAGAGARAAGPRRPDRGAGRLSR
jgi:peroxiredoxin